MAKKNEVVLIDRMASRSKKHPCRYQIMFPVGSGYEHYWPGHMFTLEDAKAQCEKEGFKILAIGDEWQCLQPWQ